MVSRGPPKPLPGKACRRCPWRPKMARRSEPEGEMARRSEPEGDGPLEEHVSPSGSTAEGCKRRLMGAGPRLPHALAAAYRPACRSTRLDASAAIAASASATRPGASARPAPVRGNWVADCTPVSAAPPAADPAAAPEVSAAPPAADPALASLVPPAALAAPTAPAGAAADAAPVVPVVPAGLPDAPVPADPPVP